jgi:hypothetical protein
VRIEVEPVLRGRRAADERAVRMKHALRITGGARGVDEIRRVIGPRALWRLA